MSDTHEEVVRPSEIVAYTRPAGDYGEPLALTAAMHLGWWHGSGHDPAPIGNGGGIWFASAVKGRDGRMQQRVLGDPSISRVGAAFIAVAVELDAGGDQPTAPRVILATSGDLIRFTDHAPVAMPSGVQVFQPSISATEEGGELSWSDEHGDGWAAALEWGEHGSRIADILRSRASRPAPVRLSDSEADGLSRWASRMQHRSDGGFVFPFAVAHADPQVFEWNGTWYLLATDDRNGDNIHSNGFHLRASSTVEGLASAEDLAIVGVGPAGMAGCFWAPEAHVIGGRLRILFAPSIGSASWDRVECHVMTLRDGGDPANPQDWSTPVPVLRADRSPLHPHGISLDMTYFAVADRHHVCWSQRTTADGTGDAELWIATIEPQDPSRLTSAPSLICTATRSWEVVDGANVAEGPYVVIRGSDVLMTYAAGGVGPNYATGLLRARMGSDLLKPESWVKAPFPILDSHSVSGQSGPGHVSFFAEGDDIFVVFHAKADRSEPERHTGIRRVRWAPDGQPILAG